MYVCFYCNFGQHVKCRLIFHVVNTVVNTGVNKNRLDPVSNASIIQNEFHPCVNTCRHLLSLFCDCFSPRSSVFNEVNADCLCVVSEITIVSLLLKKKTNNF